MEEGSTISLLSCKEVRVLEIVWENFGPNATLDAKIRNLGDSLELANLALDLEAEFGIDMPDEEMHKLVDLRDIVKYVETHG